MSLLDGVLGNASEIDATVVQEEFGQLLAPGERVERAYQVIRDYFVFTNKRFVIVDIQGLTGAKIEYHSIPYKSITHFSVETAGTFDLDAELKIWISGTQAPIAKKFNNRLNIYEVQSVLAAHVLGCDTMSRQPAQPKDKQNKSRAVDPERSHAQRTVTRSSIAGESGFEFCFHCGEAIKGDEKQCPACAGSLE